MITLSIDVTKIPRERITEKIKRDGTPAKYLNLVLVDNREGRDQYENDGFVTLSTSKEEREQGVKMPILGNFRRYEDRPREQAPAPAPSRAAARPVHPDSSEGDDIPF